MTETSAFTTLETTVAVVVHYRSYDTVAITVKNLLDQGMSAENLVLVDNSEQPERRAELQASIPSDVRVNFTSNKGYAAAVNAGMDHFSRERDSPPEFLVVATHETIMGLASIELLVDALENDNAAAAAGPTLISGDPGNEFVWSTGGYLSKIGHIPSHFDHRKEFNPQHYEMEPPRTRSWLDGAFVAYRWAAIDTERLSEEFFLYMEETDLHLRLGRKGQRVLWVPGAVVWQSSGGIPPFYLAKNLRLLFLRNEPLWRRALIPIAVTKRVVADVLKRRDFSAIRPSLRGLFSRIRTEDQRTKTPFVSIVNPLGGALAHYQRELMDNLAAAGVDFEIGATLEPSVGQKSKSQWLWDYWLTLRNAARFARLRSNSRLLVVWPVLGYLDVVLLAMLRTRSSLIIHDPRPLVSATGYGAISRALARIFKNHVEIIVHSEQAAAVVRQEAPTFTLTMLPHPMLEPVATERPASELPTVQVFGQYKPDRDLDALSSIAAALEGSAHFAIDGRGWPAVAGWEVSDRFVPEDEVDALIARSAVIIIPYRRFFQSGVAVRCLEQRTPFLGPFDSSLQDFVGRGSKLLVAGHDAALWGTAAESALQEGLTEIVLAGPRWRARAVLHWRQWAQG